MNDFKLKVRNNCLYDAFGNIIDTPAIMLDGYAGLLKYGDAGWVKTAYNNLMEFHTAYGIREMVNSIKYIQFDDKLLSIEEICTFINYAILCSANGQKLMAILNMNTDNMKSEIESLHCLGY